MTKKNQIYKCPTCGNIVEMLHGAAAPLFCCGKPMVEMIENTIDAAEEKHIPIVEKTESEIVVKVGSVEHPMDEDHFIEWIELITEDKVYRQNLEPNQKPKARFELIDSEFEIRTYCNLHGLWKNS